MEIRGEEGERERVESVGSGVDWSIILALKGRGNWYLDCLYKRIETECWR